MKRIALFLAAGLFALWLPNANAQKARVSEFTVGADIDAQGAVAKTEVEPSVTPGIAAALEQAIRYWRFVPAQHDGMAVPAHTFITAKLEILPIADGKLDLRISYVRHGPKSDLFDVLPSYPRDAIRARQQGMVVLLGELPVRGKATVTLVKCAVTQQDCGSLRRATEDWFLLAHGLPRPLMGNLCQHRRVASSPSASLPSPRARTSHWTLNPVSRMRSMLSYKSTVLTTIM